MSRWVQAARRDLKHLEDRLHTATDPDARDRLEREAAQLRSEINQAVNLTQQEVGWH